MANWLTKLPVPWRAKAPSVPSTEGQYRPGPYFLSDGWLPAPVGRYWNWWQSGFNLKPYGECSAMVEACASSISQTVAMCPGDHWRSTGAGGRERVTGSALSRVLRRPNDYQSISDFFLNLTRRLYLDGNAYALALRNDRFEITELHLLRQGKPHVAEDGSVFYALYGNEIIERRFDLSKLIPDRDVLHVRLHTPMHPLIGVSPITAVALDLAMSGAALDQQIQFWANGAKPSFMLETDQPINKEQADLLRASWIEQTTGANVGGTPILTWGLKAHAVTVTANDGKLAELMKMSGENIALAFRMPLQILGIGGPTYASTELLMQSWIATSLGFALNHIEEAFGVLFKLKGQPDEYLELDTSALLRSAFKDMVDALGLGVMRGIYAPDEARARVELPKVVGGHGAMPRVQQQVVPLSYGTELKPPTRKPAAPAVAPPNTPKPAAGSAPATPANDQGAADAARRAFRASHGRHLTVAV